MVDQQLRDRDLEAILFDLESDDEGTRRQAIFASVKLGDRAIKAIPVLQQIAGTDPSVELRYLARKALNALAQLAGPTQTKGPVRKSAGVTKLIALETPEMIAVKLSSPDANVRASALRATALKQDKSLLGCLLTRIGGDKEPDPELRSILVRVIAILGGKEQAKAVAVFLDDADARVRANAVETLAGLKDVNAFAFIVKALQDKDHRVQQAAISALHAVGSLNLLKICSFMLQAEPYWARDSAAHCLAVAKIPDSVPVLEAALADQYESVRIKARAGLEQLAALGVEPAKTALKKATGIKSKEAPTDFLSLEATPSPKPADDIASPDATARRRATRNLAVLGAVDEGHLPMLLARLKAETDQPTIANLIKAVGQVKNAVVLPVLKDYLSHESAVIRGSAVEALGAIGTDECLQAILPALKDSEAQVVGKAVLALRNYELINVGKLLEGLAKHTNAGHRRMAAFVVAELGSPEHAGVLEGLAKDADAGIAAMARETAAMLAPPSSIATVAAPAAEPAPTLATPVATAEVSEPSSAPASAAPAIGESAKTSRQTPIPEVPPAEVQAASEIKSQEPEEESAGSTKKKSRKKSKEQAIDLPSWACVAILPFIFVWFFSGMWGWLGLAAWCWMVHDADKKIPWRHARGVLATVGALAWFLVVPLYALVVGGGRFIVRRQADPGNVTQDDLVAPGTAAALAILAAIMYPAPPPARPVDAPTQQAAEKPRPGTEQTVPPAAASAPQTTDWKSEAIDCARTLVHNNLTAPATAQWVSTDVVAESHPRYLVHVVVDAQNGFGALIRNSFIASVELTGGKQFKYNRMFGLNNCENPPPLPEIEVVKKLNNWPGYEDK